MNPSFLQFISANQLTLAAGCAAGVGMCFFFFGVQFFARKRPFGCASKVTISAALPGLAAISGKAAGPRTLAAPISGKPCYVYRTSVWQLESGGKKGWKNVAEETGHVTFLIEDETGELLVEPSGAELDLRQNLSEEYGSPSSSSSQAPERTKDQLSNNNNNNEDQSSNEETVPDDVANFLTRNGITLDRPTRVEEYCLQPATPVVVTGTVTKNSALQFALQADSLASVSADSSSNQSLVTTGGSPVRASAAGDLPRQQPEIIRLASGPTPQSTTQMSQQSKIAAALAKAGLASPDMWATAEGGLPAINSLIDGHPKSEQPRPDSTSEATATPAALTLKMTMTKGPDDPTFIISNIEPASPISISWKSVALVLAGSTLTTLGLYVLVFAHLR